MPSFLLYVLLGVLAAVLILLFQANSRLTQFRTSIAAERREQAANIELLRSQIEQRAREQLEVWRTAEIAQVASSQRQIADREARAKLEHWKVMEENRIRQDALRRSEFVIKGRVTEHFAPLSAGFTYNPKDARWLGSPIDMIIFDGLDEGSLQKIIFLEIKTGNSRMSQRQRQIQDVIANSRVRFRELRL